jgi:hypothetical protein
MFIKDCKSINILRKLQMKLNENLERFNITMGGKKNLFYLTLYALINNSSFIKYQIIYFYSKIHKKRFFRAFRDAKLFIITSTSMFSNLSFSIDKVVKPLWHWGS